MHHRQRARRSRLRLLSRQRHTFKPAPRPEFHRWLREDLLTDPAWVHQQAWGVWGPRSVQMRSPRWHRGLSVIFKPQEMIVQFEARGTLIDMIFDVDVIPVCVGPGRWICKLCVVDEPQFFPDAQSIYRDHCIEPLLVTARADGLAQHLSWTSLTSGSSWVDLRWPDRSRVILGEPGPVPASGE